MEFYEENKNIVHIVLVILLAVGAYYAYQKYMKKEDYTDNANEGGGRSLTGRGIRVNNFMEDQPEGDNGGQCGL